MNSQVGSCGLHGCEEGCILCDPLTSVDELQAWGYRTLIWVERLEGQLQAAEGQLRAAYAEMDLCGHHVRGRSA